jgi:hypothetical protein
MSNKSESSIFIKQSDIAKEEHKLNYKDLLESIPEDRYEQEQLDLKSNHLEWRWRIMEINDKKMVEISILIPETIDESGNFVPPSRKYIDKYGKWVNREIDKLFDQYVTKQYFYYTDC